MRSGARLGIDVGRARIGVARCDAGGVLAVPVELSGATTPSTDDAIAFAERLAGAGAMVRLVDERLSTVSAQQALRASGKSTRKQRPIVDQVAAVIILQHAIDTERTSGTEPGRLLTTDEGSSPL